jgi:predicted DCC family thiol-disulfide oxidoreductase YuxK
MTRAMPDAVLSPSEFAGLGDRLLVIFDGYCGFCNWSIRWFLKRNRQDRLRFAASDSAAVTALLARHGYSELSPNTILVVRNPGCAEEQVLERSDAVVTMLQELPGPWRVVGRTLGLIPRFLRDLGYRFVAGIRYGIAKRYTSCPIPTAEERGHFL